MATAPGPTAAQPPLALPRLEPSQAPGPLHTRSLLPRLAQPPRPRSQVLSADVTSPQRCPHGARRPHPGHHAPPWPLSGAPLWRGAPGGIRQTLLSQFPRPLTPQPPGFQGGGGHTSARAGYLGRSSQGLAWALQLGLSHWLGPLTFTCGLVWPSLKWGLWSDFPFGQQTLPQSPTSAQPADWRLGGECLG